MSKQTPITSVVNPFITDGVPPETTTETAPPVEETPPTEETAPPVEETPPTEETAPPVEETPPADEQPTDGTKSRQPSRKDLSHQLETANAELKRLRDEGSVYDQKYKDALAKQEELEGKIKAANEEYVKKSTPVYRWEDDPDVSTPRREIVESLGDLSLDVSAETHATVQKDLMHLFSAFGDARAKGAEAQRAFKTKLVEAFGEDADKVINMVRMSYPKHVSALEAQKRNSEGYYNRVVADHQTRARQTREEFATLGRLTEAQIAEKPDDINSVISAAVAGDPELLKQIDTLAMQAAQATAGLPPISPNATPEQVEAHRKGVQALENFKGKAFRHHVEARVLAGIVTKLLAENTTLKKRVPAANAGNKPGSVATSTPSATKTDIPKTGNYAEVKNPYAA